MKQLLVILILVTTSTIMVQAQQKTVELEVIDEDGSKKEFALEWSLSGPPPTGSNTETINKVNKLLSDNGIDCPPKRQAAAARPIPLTMVVELVMVKLANMNKS